MVDDIFLNLKELAMDAPKIDVLDKGYIRIPVENDKALVFGSDLSIVNAARASFMKESDSFNNSDEKLIKYLIKNNEWSPFRHAFITFEVKAPLMVARQWFKYVVGSDHTMDAWNETSRRYVTLEPEFYIPTASEWRSMPDNRKQGSGANIERNHGQLATYMLQEQIAYALEQYKYATEVLNIATEQARVLLPANCMYTVWRWTASINSICWFMAQRLENNAQHEISMYAAAVQLLVSVYFPSTAKWFKEYRSES